MKYEEWLKQWLQNYVKPSVKNRTYVRYSEIVKQHLIPNFGNMELTEITPYKLQCFITELTANGNLKSGKGLSSNSVNAIVTVIQTTLKTAHMLGYVNEYVGDKIKRPKITEKAVECFLISEQKTIEKYISEAKNDKLFGIILCLYTGLRIGELLSLEWTDINLKNSELSVNKTCYDGKNADGVFTRITEKPKTISSIRIIPFPKQLIPILKQMKKNSKSKYVISNGENYIMVRSYQRTFDLILKKLNIKHKGFHSLRHTFATRALECGMDVKTLSEILGHKNSAVTLNRYAHSLMEHKKAMMNKLGKLL